jgi:hypothetical protein
VSERRIAVALAFAALLAGAAMSAGQAALPTTPLTYGFFTVQFGADGAFSLKGDGWPTFVGTWTRETGTLEVATPAVAKCDAPGRYRVETDGRMVRLDLIDDACTPRRMILHRSAWRPIGESEKVPERRIQHFPASPIPALPPAATGHAGAANGGHWPSFRGTVASGIADGQQLPDSWNPATGENVLWRTRIPGLGH